MNSKYILPYSQKMSFYLSVKPREYKELLHYNSWCFCLHRNTVVKFCICWIHLLILKLVVVVSFFPSMGAVHMLCWLKQSIAPYGAPVRPLLKSASPVIFHRTCGSERAALCVLSPWSSPWTEPFGHLLRVNQEIHEYREWFVHAVAPRRLERSAQRCCSPERRCSRDGANSRVATVRFPSDSKDEKERSYRQQAPNNQHPPTISKWNKRKCSH